MKLRNKKTGEIKELEDIVIFNAFDEDGISDAVDEFYSISELNDIWEDAKEPLIKDEKIRKAVKTWAEANELESDFELRYSENSFSLISWQATIEFNVKIMGLKRDKRYTITELVGEEL